MVTLKDKLETVLANLTAERERAVDALRYSGEAYPVVQSIVVGLREDIDALAGIIRDLPVDERG